MSLFVLAFIAERVTVVFYIPDFVVRRLLDLESPMWPAFAKVAVLFVAGRSLSWRPSSNQSHLNCAPIHEKPDWNVDNLIIS